jgi:hypothetical protein
LGSWWTVILEVPGLIELCVVAAFHQPGIHIKINDIVIGCREAKENTREVVAIEFAAPVAASFDTHTRTENL